MKTPKQIRQQVADLVTEFITPFCNSDICDRLPVSVGYLNRMLQAMETAGMIVEVERIRGEGSGRATIYYQATGDYFAQIRFENMAASQYVPIKHRKQEIPRCADREAYELWRSSPGARALINGFCTDCLPEYRDKMAAKGLCDYPETVFFFDSDGFVSGRREVSTRTERKGK